MKKYLVLENIRSAYNVGAMFRTAEGAGVHQIILAGYTPAPIDRFGRVHKEIEKTSLGANDLVPWEKEEDCVAAVRRLQANGVQTVAVEQTAAANSLQGFTPGTDVAYVMGNEVDGVSEEVLDIVDVVVFIPMLGEKESLNVATAAGIVLYHDVVQYNTST